MMRQLLRLVINAFPDGTPLLVLSGPLRGARWSKRSPFSGYITGRYEHRQQRAFAAMIRPNDVVYDLGAHHGFYTVLAARLAGRGGRVVACEPDGRNCVEIRRNVTLNGFAGRCVVVEAALSDRDGTADFQTFADPSPTGTLVGKLAAVRSHRDWAPEEVASTFAVPTVTVDGLAAKFELPAVVKCDVEGAESLVLRGAERTLQAGRTTWLLSVHNDNEAAACLATFSRHGYRKVPVVERSPEMVWAMTPARR